MRKKASAPSSPNGALNGGIADDNRAAAAARPCTAAARPAPRAHCRHRLGHCHGRAADSSGGLELRRALPVGRRIDHRIFDRRRPVHHRAVGGAKAPRRVRLMDHDSYSDTYIRGILNTVKSIAMVGFSPKENRPSYFAFKYLLERGYTMIP